VSSVDQLRIRRPGFTLVELLTVVAVIAALVAVLLPTLTDARRSARSVQCVAKLRALGQAFQIYLGQNGGWYPYGWDVYGGNAFGFSRAIEWSRVIPPLLKGSATDRPLACPAVDNPFGSRHFGGHPDILERLQDPYERVRSNRYSDLGRPSAIALLFDASVMGDGNSAMWMESFKNGRSSNGSVTVNNQSTAGLNQFDPPNEAPLYASFAAPYSFDAIGPNTDNAGSGGHKGFRWRHGAVSTGRGAYPKMLSNFMFADGHVQTLSPDRMTFSQIRRNVN
jgi:prepilin-type N-terminal cleavage/methylation domain-containing protein/prepilin-type processing-associated H-X9-DG protein